jgi:hypothetical protein
VSDPSVLEVYNRAIRMRAELHVENGRYRIHLGGITLDEGILRREPMFSGI